MSASKQKKIRQDQTSTGWANPKTAHEAQAAKDQKRSNLLYTVIAVVFVLVAIAAVIWRSNILPKSVTAVTIDGEKYTANEVSFYYQNNFRNFMNENYYTLAYLGVDMNSPLDSQKIDETTAAFVGATAGQTWKEFFTDSTLEQMASIQAVLKAAEDEGFVYPDSVQAEYDEAMANLKANAEASKVSEDKYLQSSLGRSMTAEVYSTHVLRMLQYSAYMDAYRDSLDYTDADMTAAYEEAPKAYDKVSYESITVNGAPEIKKDDEGNPIEATEEEAAAAKEAAKAAADGMLTAFQSGSTLQTLADSDEKASYAETDAAVYTEGNAISEWLFDDARKDGDAAVLENGSSYALVVFHTRARETCNTIDVRHILIRPAVGEKSEGDEGYEEEQAQLMADAKAKAEEVLDQWKSGAATEDSFAELAKENSADSNAAQGGIYERVSKGDMVEPFNDWCFDEARKAGDTGIVETDFGYHVMYFVGDNLPKWQADAYNNLLNADFAAWADEFGKDYTTDAHGFGMRFVG